VSKTTTTTDLHCRILYAEDDTDDRSFLSESVSYTGLPADIDYVSNGDEAIRYLEGKTSGELPQLIVLDLNMPRRDGKETLTYIKRHPQFSNIPVVILSTSANSSDREYCSTNGADFYYIKPDHISGYRDLVKNFISYCVK
jgi:CheY-like chemotaxis protein